MNTQHLLLWCLLGAIFISCAYWHVQENKKLGRQWRRDMDGLAAQRLVKFAWLRTVQVLFLLACFLLFIVVYDVKLTSTEHTINDLNQLKTELSRKLAQVMVKTATPPPTPQSPPAPLVTMPQGNVPAAAVSPSTALPPQQPAAAGTQGATVADIYNPEAKNTDQQSQMDELKKRYEDILVIYRFLNKCGRTRPTDYNIIISALQQETAALKAPAGMQSSILTAAQGSYREMYALSPCNGAGFNTLFNQYTAYIKMLAQRLPQKP